MVTWQRFCKVSAWQASWYLLANPEVIGIIICSKGFEGGGISPMKRGGISSVSARRHA